jgi:rhomboid protease GluP
LRGSVTGFVGYNLLIGAVTPNVDNAAHVGGLITGFLVGLAVQRPWPVTQPHRAVLRRLAGLGVSVALLYVAGTFAVRWAAANPKVAEVKGRVDDNRSAVGAYNRFIRGIEPQVLSSDLISRQVEQVLKDVDTETVTAEQALDKLREILDYTTRQRDLTQSMSMERADLSSIRLALVRVQDSLIDAIRLSMTLIQTTEGPQAEAIAKQFDEACEKKVQAERDFEESVRAYATLHNMTLRPK